MRIFLIVAASFGGFLVVCCVLGIFVGLPQLRDELESEVHEAVSTEVARRIPAIPGTGAEPGEYIITQESLQASIRENADNERDAENLFVRITPAQVEVGLVSRGQDATYSGVPAAENGQLVMHDMDSNNRFFEFVLSPDRLGRTIAEAVNSYLAQNGLQLQSLELQDGQMVLITVEA
ncbi:MAG: hypothetical protein DCC58_00160 [Chloroflexi bacterium]|nr:MAG: hypothetical protein DCC58_00160 [Chloroflexota bacterium]